MKYLIFTIIMLMFGCGELPVRYRTECHMEGTREVCSNVLIDPSPNHFPGEGRDR